MVMVMMMMLIDRFHDTTEPAYQQKANKRDYWNDRNQGYNVITSELLHMGER